MSLICSIETGMGLAESVVLLKFIHCIRFFV